MLVITQKLLQDQQKHFGFMDVFLLQSGHNIFRPLMCLSSEWWEQEYKCN